MTLTVTAIANALGLTVLGDGDLPVTRLAEPATAAADDLALAMSPRYAGDLLANAQVQAAVVWANADWQALGLKAAIAVHHPRLAMAVLTQAFDTKPVMSGIHHTALVDVSARVADGVSIGPFCVIGADVVIGACSWIDAHVTVAAGVQIGSYAAIHAGVRLQRRVMLGDHVILHPNVVIGGDGFSFTTAGPSHLETAMRTLGKTPLTPLADSKLHRTHSLGGVIIGNHVEIGANSTVDAGTIRATHVGDGTKVDNLVQIGHNVRIGRDCLLCAQTAIAGSTVIGDRVILGGKSGVADNLTIGSDVVLGGAAIALADIPDGRFMMGYPAQPMLEHRAGLRALRQTARRQKPVSKPGDND